MVSELFHDIKDKNKDDDEDKDEDMDEDKNEDKNDDDFPDVWYCSMNTWDMNLASCTALEDK